MYILTPGPYLAFFYRGHSDDGLHIITDKIIIYGYPHVSLHISGYPRDRLNLDSWKEYLNNICKGSIDYDATHQIL